MIDALKKLWGQSAETKPSEDLSLAVASLMMEVMRTDGKLEDSEYTAMTLAIRERFSLSEEALRQLLRDAEKATAQSHDFHRFTSQVIKAYSSEERISILSDLWRIAMADGQVDAYEEHLLRRIATLIGLYHHEFIQAKQAARTPV